MGRRELRTMLNPDYPDVSVSALLSTVERYHKRELLLAGIVLVATGFVALQWLFRWTGNVPFLGVLIFLWSVLWGLQQLEIPEGQRIEEADPEELGHYSVEALHQMVRDLCHSFGEKEVPYIYVVNSAEGNAYVINVDILNFIPRWNAVYIGSYLLHSLEEDELKAIIAHELCHFSLHSTFWSRYFYIKPFVFAVWNTMFLYYPFSWLWGYTEGGVNFWLVVLLLLVFGLIPLVWSIVQVIVVIAVGLMTLRPDSQEIESLCDVEGAKRFGILAMSNALLKIGSRQEIFGWLMARLSPDLTDPMKLPENQSTASRMSASRTRFKHPAYRRAREQLREMKLEAEGAAASDDHEPTDEEIKQQMLVNRSEVIVKAYEHLSERLPKGFVSLEDSLHLIDEAIEEADGEIFFHEPKELLRWLDFDNLTPNYRIDPEEYDAFIASLRENEGVPLFFIPDEFCETFASQAEHPSIRQRILFLDYNKDASSLPLSK